MASATLAAAPQAHRQSRTRAQAQPQAQPQGGPPQSRDASADAGPATRRPAAAHATDAEAGVEAPEEVARAVRVRDLVRHEARLADAINARSVSNVTPLNVRQGVVEVVRPCIAPAHLRDPYLRLRSEA